MYVCGGYMDIYGGSKYFYSLDLSIFNLARLRPCGSFPCWDDLSCCMHFAVGFSKNRLYQINPNHHIPPMNGHKMWVCPIFRHTRWQAFCTRNSRGGSIQFPRLLYLADCASRGSNGSNGTPGSQTNLQSPASRTLPARIALLIGATKKREKMFNCHEASAFVKELNKSPWKGHQWPEVCPNSNCLA